MMLSNLPKKLNPKQMHYSDGIKRVILEGRPFTFDEFVQFKDECSGSIPVEYGRSLVEVKSSYVLQNRDLKIKAKNEAVARLVRSGLADRFVLVTEKNSFELFGFTLPKTKQCRKKLFEKTKGKVAFHSEKFEKEYYGKVA